MIIPKKFPRKIRTLEQEIAAFIHVQESNKLSKVVRLIDLITAQLNDPATLKKFKAHPGDWTRKANLTFDANFPERKHPRLKNFIIGNMTED